MNAEQMKKEYEEMEAKEMENEDDENFDVDKYLSELEEEQEEKLMDSIKKTINPAK